MKEEKAEILSMTDLCKKKMSFYEKKLELNIKNVNNKKIRYERNQIVTFVKTRQKTVTFFIVMRNLIFLCWLIYLSRISDLSTW